MSTSGTETCTLFNVTFDRMDLKSRSKERGEEKGNWGGGRGEGWGRRVE